MERHGFGLKRLSAYAFSVGRKRERGSSWRERESAQSVREDLNFIFVCNCQKQKRISDSFRNLSGFSGDDAPVSVPALGRDGGGQPKGGMGLHQR